jgi:hypothetical protein
LPTPLRKLIFCRILGEPGVPLELDVDADGLDEVAEDDEHDLEDLLGLVVLAHVDRQEGEQAARDDEQVQVVPVRDFGVL